MSKLVATFLCLIGLSASLAAQQPAKPGGDAPPAKFTTTDSYPSDTCFVSDEALDKSAKVFTVEGHTFKTCCGKCKAKIEKDPKPWIEKKEAAVIAAQSSSYALTTCPISGKNLTDKAVSVVADNTLVKLCCPNCKDKLRAAPAAAIAKVQAAAFAKQASAYAAKSCPVSGHDLDENAVAVMHGSTLVKLCCEDCMEKFTASANAMASKVAPKAEGKTEKSGGKAEGKAGDQSGHDMPMAATPGEAGGAACCETGKAESGCCQAGGKTAGKPEGGSGCCEAAKKDAKPECCEGSKAEKAAPAKKAN